MQRCLTDRVVFLQSPWIFLIERPLTRRGLIDYNGHISKVLMEKSTDFTSLTESRHRVGTGGGEMRKFVPELHG